MHTCAINCLRTAKSQKYFLMFIPFLSHDVSRAILFIRRFEIFSFSPFFLFIFLTNSRFIFALLLKNHDQRNNEAFFTAGGNLFNAKKCCCSHETPIEAPKSRLELRGSRNSNKSWDDHHEYFVIRHAEDGSQSILGILLVVF